MELPSLMQAAGLLGVSGYIVGFASLQLRLIDGNSKLFCVISIINASLVLISLIEHFNLPSALIQVSWIVIGIGGLTIRLMRDERETGSFKSRRHR